MTFIKPPISKHSSFIEISKFNTTWNLCLLFVPLFFILFSAHILSSDPDIVISFSGLVFTFTCLLILKRNRDYKIVGLVLAGAGSLMIQIGLFIVADTLLMVTVAWVMLIVLISYYLLNKLLGTLFLMTNLLCLFYYLLFMKNEYPIYNDLVHSTSTNLKAIINLIVITVIIAFLIYNFLHTIETANKKLSESNKTLQAKNHEKEVLLQEIHHRVKNNLQLIIAMLSLQSSEISDEVTLSPFVEAKNRIRSMALIHEKMYESHNLAHINIKTYFDELVSEIVFSSKNKTQINTEIHSNVIQTEIKNIVPLALIINELITNSIKYAFENKKEALIVISIDKKENTLFVDYKDNGSGGVKLNSKGIGSKLIKALTQQLKGTYEIVEDNGVLYRFQFAIASDDSSWVIEKNNPFFVHKASNKALHV